MKIHHNYIALADILANGVVVLLILITLSLSAKQQDLEKELEQISEIGSVMSREIASSVITNALPSSSPAVLHDYGHNRRKQVPRIELHKTHLLIGGRGDGTILNLRISKEQLLQDNNRFDKFLSNLIPAQKGKMRMDIYHIKHYYLVLSILKKHQAKIHDWHFLGNKNFKGAAADKPNTGDGTDQLPLLDLLEIELPPSPKSGQGRLTDEVDFATPEIGGSGTEPDGEKRGGGEKSDSELDFGGGLKFGAKAMAKEVSRLMAKSSGKEDEHFLGALKISFSDGSTLSKEDLKTDQDGESEQATSKQVLAFLLGYLANRQGIYEGGGFVEINAKDFGTARIIPLFDDYKNEIEDLYQNISSLVGERIQITHNFTVKSALTLAINKNLDLAKLATQPDVKPEILPENLLNIRLYPLPTINNGEQIDIDESDVILFANRHNNQQNKGFNWQLVAIIDANLSDIKIGFVFAKHAGKTLIFDTTANNVRLNGQAITTYYLGSKSSDYWKWGVLILILLIFLTLLFRRSDAQ